MPSLFRIESVFIVIYYHQTLGLRLKGAETVLVTKSLHSSRSEAALSRMSIRRAGPSFTLIFGADTIDGFKNHFISECRKS